MEPIATLGGRPIIVDPAAVPAALTGKRPEPIHTHWVEIEGVRWPPKQAFELITGIPRRKYTSHRALEILNRLGLPSSSWRSSKAGSRTAASVAVPAPTVEAPAVEAPMAITPPPVVAELRDAVETLAGLLTGQRLTDRLGALEHQMHGADSEQVSAAAREAELDEEALLAALRVRRAFGRMSDVIHATAIALTLEQIMEPGETLTTRPSLGAGNDPKRRYDVETDRRIAEFKLAVWRGADAMRKRAVAQDLVHLALDEQGKKRQLFVVGDLPRKHLEESTSPMAWNLDRASKAQRQRFVEGFGTESLTMPLCQFRRTCGSDVQIIDLTKLLPDLRALLEVV